MNGGEKFSEKDFEMVSIKVDAKVYAGGGEASRHSVVKE